MRAECADHSGGGDASVTRVVIPRLKEGFPYQTVGFIFVEFLQPAMARSAALALNGRKFADKTVIVDYVSNAIGVH